MTRPLIRLYPVDVESQVYGGKSVRTETLISLLPSWEMLNRSMLVNTTELKLNGNGCITHNLCQASSSPFLHRSL